MTAQSFYEVLGLESSATSQEIKTAYRQLALQWHPDRNQDDPEAEERFKQISLAYAVLGDPVRRSEYDRGSARSGADLDFGLDLEDLLRQIFGRRRRRRKRGEDLRYMLKLSFEDAIRGVETTIQVPRLVLCTHCDGSGVTVNRVCEECAGAGRAERLDRLLVPVPAGIAAEKRLRMAGFGNEGVGGGRPGDLFVQVEIQEHPILRRIGNDLECEVPLTMAEAALGTEVRVPTVDGTVRLRIPPGAQPGDTVRLSGRGVPGKEPGDQLVHLRIVVPTGISREEQDQLERLRSLRRRVDEPVAAEYEEKVDLCASNHQREEDKE